MQSVVYWLTFESRVKNKTRPYYYIGSKHNCSFVDGKIIDKYGKEYWSSCKQDRFKEALRKETPTVKILHVCDNVLDEEEKYHKHYDVAKSDLFFNKSTASGKFGGNGENSPRFGKKNSPESNKKLSDSVKGIPKSTVHKYNISNGLNRFYDSDVKINNSRGRSVVKTLSDSAKRRNSNPLNEHPRGMLGKKMPREKCVVCGKLVSVNYIARHTNNCKLN